MRTFTSWSLAALCLAALFAFPAPAGAATGSLTDLTAAVVTQVTDRYPNAYLVEVDGSAPAGPTDDVTGVTDWRYVFNDIKDGCACKVMVPAHLDGTVGAFAAQPGIWVGSTALHPPFAMEPTEADALLKAAGFTGDYKFVTLRRPNAGSFEPHPLFIFGKFTGLGYIAVDTVTGEVKRIS